MSKRPAQRGTHPVAEGHVRVDDGFAPCGPGDDDRWLLGPNSISAGSLHSDVWTGPAIELLDRNMLCIKPVVGWCRERASPEVCNTARRYALIVTLTAKNQALDIYTRSARQSGCRSRWRSPAQLAPAATAISSPYRSKDTVSGSHVSSSSPGWKASKVAAARGG